MNMRLKTSTEIANSAIWKNFERLCRDMSDKTLAAFLLWWINPNTETGRRYFTSPGSRPGTGHGHHAYIGGLAVHSIRSAFLATQISAHYRKYGYQVNTDLVVAGVLIHDIGKAWSYEPLNEDQTEWGHTEESKHLHHIPIGHRELTNALSGWVYSMSFSPLDEDLILQLQHIILSHHGRVAWSSPVSPRTPEAYIVHLIEMMDGYLDGKYFPGNPPRRLYENN